MCLSSNCCRYLLIAGSTYPDFVTELPICTDWKGDSYDPILVIVNRLIRWKDLSMDFVTGLPICTDWKGTSYDLIPADENGTLQAGADNDQCTRACGGHYRYYSSSDVCWSFKANLSMDFVTELPISTGEHQLQLNPGYRLSAIRLLELDCGYHPHASHEDIDPRSRSKATDELADDMQKDLSA